MSRHGFGIVGWGVIAPFHARAIRAIPGSRLIAVADIVADRARTAAAEFGADWYDNANRLFERPDIDIVCVCAPASLHAELGTKAAASGKHVVIEKPIEVSLPAADRLIDTCRSAGVKLTVIYQHRNDPGAVQVRRLVDSGRLGRPILGNAIVHWYRTQEYYESAGWRGSTADSGGGSLMNQGIHYLDLLIWLMGPVERVFARTTTAAHDGIEVEDLSVAILSFANGALGMLETSTAVYPGLPERLEITGTGGTAIIEEGELIVCELKDEKGETPPYGRPVNRKVHTPLGPDPGALDQDLHLAQLTEFVAAIDANREPAVTGEDARHSLEVILAAYESARTEREVVLPLAVSRSARPKSP